MFIPLIPKAAKKKAAAVRTSSPIILASEKQ